MSTTVASIRQTALHHFSVAADRLDLEPAVRKRLVDPKEQIELSINPALPSGRVVHAKAFVVIHNDAIGPAKGGIRMTKDVTLDDIMGLAMEMTWKTSIIGVPFGGGKSGISFETEDLSPMDKESLIRSFTRAARRHIGPELYIPAPDMGTNEEDMAHIRDCIAYSEGRSITAGCFVTGKPLILGGIAGRREATGKGVVYTVLALCERRGIKVGETRVAVQGFGNVGSVAAVELAANGATIVGVSDINGATANPDGLDIDALSATTTRAAASTASPVEPIFRARHCSKSIAIFSFLPRPGHKLPTRTPLGSERRSSPKGPTPRPRPARMPF